MKSGSGTLECALAAGLMVAALLVIVLLLVMLAVLAAIACTGFVYIIPLTRDRIVIKIIKICFCIFIC